MRRCGINDLSHARTDEEGAGERLTRRRQHLYQPGGVTEVPVGTGHSFAASRKLIPQGDCTQRPASSFDKVGMGLQEYRSPADLLVG